MSIADRPVDDRRVPQLRNRPSPGICRAKASWATWTRARQRLSIRAGARSWPCSHAPRVSLAVRLVRRIFARYRAGNDSDAGPVSASFARAARRVARDFTASGADRLSRIVNADDNSAYASGACALAPSRARAAGLVLRLGFGPGQADAIARLQDLERLAGERVPHPQRVRDGTAGDPGPTSSRPPESAQFQVEIDTPVAGRP